MSTSTLGQEASVVDQTSPAPFILVSMLMFLGALFLFLTYLIGRFFTLSLLSSTLFNRFLSRFSNQSQRRQRSHSETIGQRSWLQVTREASWTRCGGHFEGRNSSFVGDWSRFELWSCPLWGGRRLTSSLCRGGWAWGSHPIHSGSGGGNLRLRRGRCWSDSW